MSEYVENDRVILVRDLAEAQAGCRARVVSAHEGQLLVEVFDEHGRTIALTDATEADVEPDREHRGE